MVIFTVDLLNRTKSIFGLCNVNGAVLNIETSVCQKESYIPQFLLHLGI